MTATQSPPEPAPDRVRLAGCPLAGTPDVGLTAQDATTALGVPTRRRASSGGIPVATSMWRDAQTVRTYGPAVAKALALRVAGKARSRLTGRHCRKFMQLTDFDPFDPAIAADPYPHYRELLAGERVQYNPKRDVYILSRYADVREAARNHDTLSSARGVTFSRGWLPFLPTSDPPAHTRMRKQLAPGMARGALETWRPMVDQLARELVGGLLTQTPADVVSTVAAPMPMRAITSVLGVDGPDEAAFCRLSNQAVRITDVALSASGLISLVQGFAGFRRLRALFTHRRDNGLLRECTVLGKLATHAEQGRLSDDELFFFAVLLLVAGYESTAHMISTLFLTLADYPDQLTLLAQQPDLIPSAIEEHLRFISPIQNICRTTRVDYSVGQAVIPAGSLVLLAWGAANRDPRQYEDPDVFRADRTRSGISRSAPASTCVRDPAGAHGGSGDLARDRRQYRPNRGGRAADVDDKRQPSRLDPVTGRRYPPRRTMKALRSSSRLSRWREWAAPLWVGCNFSAWMRLLIRNRFAVHHSRWHFAVLYTFLSMVNSCLGLWQKIVFGRRVAETVIADPPIFIVGHWRTGTTLLHELLVVDDRHTGPTGYECLAPHHFLLTEWFAPYVEFLVSKHRAMDNMDLSLHHPQEDEFVWCMQGLPSPYLTIAFPNRPPQYEEYLDLEQVAPRELEIWKRTLFRFVQQVYFRRRKTVILKNPTHSFRIKVLLEVFPQAKFIHIVRDPYVVYPSTIHLHKALYRIHGLQQPTFDGLDDKVVSTYVDLYRKLDEGRELVDPTRFYELRYEDLIGDPEGQLRRLYQHLGLGDFECYLPRLRQYLADHADYKTNSYQLTVEQRAIVDEHWGEIIDRYGYDRHTPEPARLRPAVGG